jgi:HK97 family phage major capsid protein
MARIDSDASVGWHAENASITPSEPTFGAATLSAKTIVSVCKLSLELSQDSINVEQAITRSLAGAMAVEIDGAGLGNTVANGPSGILSFSGRNQLPGIGALGDYDKFIDGMGALLGANVALEDIGPVVLGTAAWRDLAKLKTGITNDNTPLPKPSVLTMPFLPTTAVEGGSPLTSTAYMADWRDLLFGIRTEITVRVLTEAFFASNLQLAVVVFARVDYQPAREASFVTLEGIEHS